MQFHFNRAGVWGVVLLRVLLGREWGISAAVTIVLLLPALVHCLPLRLYTRCAPRRQLVAPARPAAGRCVQPIQPRRALLSVAGMAGSLAARERTPASRPANEPSAL